MGMTIAEKILAAHGGRDEVKPGEFLWCKVDASVGIPAEALAELDVDRLFNKDRTYVVEDHQAPPPNIAAANNMKKLRENVKKYGIKNFFDYGRQGILHQVFPENGMIAPGELIPMPDSHSTAGGVFNACVTNAAMDSILGHIFGEYWFRVPESQKWNLVGDFPGPDGFIVGKDVVLKITGTYGTDIGLYKSMEMTGPVASQMSLASRWTISNMGVEMGAKFCIFEYDEKTEDFLRGRVNRPYTPVFADADAEYEDEFTLDVTGLEPQVACPHDPGNVKGITELEAEKIRIDQGLIGSCTNARLEDFQMAARILKGNKIHPDVRLLCSPASMNVWREVLDAGLWQTFSDAGANIEHSTCGPCYGGHMGVLGDGEVCIASTNRNFQGRQGSPDAFVYLANPAVVAASCVKGHIADPRQFL